MSSDNLEKIDSIQHGGNNLSRQITMTISPEQYEKLFFQPSPPRGDLSKRLGNPTLLGLCGFLIPYTTTIFCLLQWHGADVSSTIAISGTYYFLGGIAMNVAAICEFILGNTFPFAVFMIYGCHWCNLGYTSDPAHHLSTVFATAQIANGADTAPYASGQGFYNVTMTLISFVFLLGSLRTNIPFVITFFCLIFLFAFLAAAEFAIPTAATLAQQEYVAYLVKLAGGFGLVAALMGWYLAIITACASTGVPCPLPVFDLSGKLFTSSKAAAGERAGAGGSAVAVP